MKDGSKLLYLLLQVSEKAANIARTCRQNHVLFERLVQEKSEKEKNPRFFQDFKTLADVLIQETIRHEIALEFPELAAKVQGEENNEFSNTVGESVIVEVCNSCEETTELLAKVMDNDIVAAKLLATEVHRDVQFSDVPTVLNIPDDFDISFDDLGIWIDPIDSTADYIDGGEMVDDATGVHLKGLRCVVVLIGVYFKTTGLPVIGVMNQPFYTETESKWNGNCYWGFLDNDIGRCSIDITRNSSNIILLSRTEDVSIKSKLTAHGFTVMEVAGAGYKIFCVAMGYAAAYILSKGSTYKWDTCAPHALLRALGGGIIEFKHFIANSDSKDLSLMYSASPDNASNSNGLIAYRNSEILQSFKGIFRE